MWIERLTGKKLVIDTNALLYYLTGECSNGARDILSAVSQRKIIGITTTRIVDEFLFKGLLLFAKEKFGLKKNVLRKLKNNRQLIPSLKEDHDRLIKFIKFLNLEIIEIISSHFFRLSYALEKGLIGNDALTFVVMRERNLKYILTADQDFEGIEGISVINPLKI